MGLQWNRCAFRQARVDTLADFQLFERRRAIQSSENIPEPSTTSSESVSSKKIERDFRLVVGVYPRPSSSPMSIRLLAPRSRSEVEPTLSLRSLSPAYVNTRLGWSLIMRIPPAS